MTILLCIITVLCSCSDVYAEVPFDNATFRVTAVAHPHTYINKVLFGSAQGTLKLWNIRRNELIHTFVGWGPGAGVTVLEQVRPWNWLNPLPD
jgi:U3 small nucleolar RNA-associated protein 21